MSSSSPQATMASGAQSTAYFARRVGLKVCMFGGGGGFGWLGVYAWPNPAHCPVFALSRSVRTDCRHTTLQA